MSAEFIDKLQEQHQSLITKLSDKYDTKISALKEEVASAQAKAEAADGAAASAEAECASLTRTLKATLAEKDDAEARADASEAETTRLSAALEEAKTDLAACHEAISELNLRLSETHSAAGNADSASTELQLAVAQQVETIDDLRGELGEARVANAGLESELARVRSAHDSALSAAGVLKSDMLAAAKAASESVARVAEAEAEILALQTHADALQAKLDAVEANKGGTEDAMSILAAQHEAALAQVQQAQAAVDAAQQELADANQAAAANAAALQESIQTLSSSLAKTEGRLAAEQAARRNDKAAFAALKAKLTAAIDAAAASARDAEDTREVLVHEQSAVQELRTSVSSLVAEIASLKTALNEAQSGAPGWVPDDDVSSCSLCNLAFSFYRRKHHCRNCGNLVCYSCSPSRLPTPNSKGKPVRVCTACADPDSSSVRPPPSSSPPKKRVRARTHTTRS